MTFEPFEVQVSPVFLEWNDLLLLRECSSSFSNWKILSPILIVSSTTCLVKYFAASITHETLSPIVMVHILTLLYPSLVYILLYLISSFWECEGQKCQSTPYQVHVIWPLVSWRPFENSFLLTEERWYSKPFSVMSVRSFTLLTGRVFEMILCICFFSSFELVTTFLLHERCWSGVLFNI